MMKDFSYVEKVLGVGAVVETIHICGSRVLIYFIDPLTGLGTLSWVPREYMTITNVPDGDIDIHGECHKKTKLTLVADNGKVIENFKTLDHYTPKSKWRLKRWQLLALKFLPVCVLLVVLLLGQQEQLLLTIISTLKQLLAWLSLAIEGLNL